jgi:protein O-GlcNAc transferase
MSISFQDAVALHQAGQLMKAEAAYRAILSATPRHAQALHLLGLLRLKLGDARDGLTLINKAVQADPAVPMAHFHLGSIQAELGRHSEAQASFAAALALKPDDAQSHFGRGNALFQLGRIAEAATAFENAARLAPDNIEALLNLGSMLQELRRYDEALDACDRALAVSQDFPPALNNRGNTLRLMGRLEEALSAFDKAIAEQPDYAKARYNRANALRHLGHKEDALEECDRIIALAPDYADACYLRGTILVELRREEEALASFDRAIFLNSTMCEAFHGRTLALVALGRLEEALANCDHAAAVDPTSAMTHNNRGAVLRKLGRFHEAKACFDRAIALQPDLAEAYFNRGGPLYELGRLEEALADANKALTLRPDYVEAVSFHFCLAGALCDWRGRAERTVAITNYCRQQRDIEVFALLHTVDDPELHLLAARSAAPPAKRPMAAAPAAKHERMRIAYLSPDFRDHPVAHQAVEMFERHDKTRFETYGVSLLRAPPSNVRDRLNRAFSHFIEIDERSNQEIARRLTALEIDILVDLGGYTDKARPQVMAYRPAPLSVEYLGYPGTLGADYVDYIIADSCVVPAGSERFYTEKVIRLPGCFMPYDSAHAAAPRRPSRAEEGLPERGFIFCNFNKSDKITPEIFDIWMRLLGAVSGSVLWLNMSNATARANLRAEAEARHIAANRLVFAERRQDRAQHLARIALADLFLDTLPYNAHATASDFLGAGVPVLSCIGRSFAARVAASMLKAIGVEELVVGDLQAYEAMALTLARTPQLLSALRARIVFRRAPDVGERIARHLETAYRTIWDRHVRGLKPEGFEVS